MASNLIERIFYNTCVPIMYPCKRGERYTDPCSCISYYECEQRSRIIRRDCSDGTAFVYEEDNFCQKLEDVVFNKVCDLQKPWERCSDSVSEEVDEDELKRRCTNIGSEVPRDEDSGVDGGLIAGIVIGVLILIVIAVVLIIYIRKKGNPIQHIKETRLWKSVVRKDGGEQGSSQPSATPHGDDHEHEETYAEIDDTALYKDPAGAIHLTHNMSHTNETYERGEEEEEEVVAYDNPALKRDTLPVPPDADSYPAPLEYSALDGQREILRSYSSLNENRAVRSSGASSAEPVTSDDGYLVAEAIGQSQRSSSPADPNYFVLGDS